MNRESSNTAEYPTDRVGEAGTTTTSTERGSMRRRQEESSSSSTEKRPSNAVQSRYRYIFEDLTSREVFDDEINSVRARSLAIVAAVKKAEETSQKGNTTVTDTKNPQIGGSSNKQERNNQRRPSSFFTANNSDDSIGGNTSTGGGVKNKKILSLGSNAPRSSPLRVKHTGDKVRTSGEQIVKDEDDAQQKTTRKGVGGGELYLRQKDTNATTGTNSNHLVAPFKTPYFSEERRFIDDLTAVVEESRVHALAVSGGAPSTSPAAVYVAFSSTSLSAVGKEQQQQSKLKSDNTEDASKRREEKIIGGASTPDLRLGRRGVLRGGEVNDKVMEKGVSGEKEEVPARAHTTMGFYPRTEHGHSSPEPAKTKGGSKNYGAVGDSVCLAVDLGDSPSVSGVLQRAIEHVRYPEAEARLRERLKRKYDAEHRSPHVVDRYFSTPNINPSTAVGLLSQIQQQQQDQDFSRNKSRGDRTQSPPPLFFSPVANTTAREHHHRPPLNALPRKPAAAPIADGTANPTIVTATVDFNALHLRDEDQKEKDRVKNNNNNNNDKKGEKMGLVGNREVTGVAVGQGSSSKSALGDEIANKDKSESLEIDNKKIPSSSSLLREADSIFSKLDPNALIHAAPKTHEMRERLRIQTREMLADAQSAVLIDSLCTATAVGRPTHNNTRGGSIFSFGGSSDDEDEEVGTNSRRVAGGGGAASRARGANKKAELREALERSNALRAVFSRESDSSDEDNFEDTILQNDVDLPCSGSIRREEQHGRRSRMPSSSKDQQSSRLFPTSLSRSKGRSSSPSSPSSLTTAPSQDDELEDLCDLLECCIISFCEYMHRTTPLGGMGVGGGRGGGHNSIGGANASSPANPLFASFNTVVDGGAGYEGPPRDIAILRSILIHALSSSIVKLREALRAIESMRRGGDDGGEGTAAAAILEHPLNITAVASTGTMMPLSSSSSFLNSHTSPSLSTSFNGCAGTQTMSPLRMSAPLKAALRERQQEVRLRLFRSWTKAFEVLLALDLRHEKNTSSTISSIAAMATATVNDTRTSTNLQNESAQRHAPGLGRAMVLGSGGGVGGSVVAQRHAAAVESFRGDTSVASSIHASIPESFSVHSDVHMKRASAYYCSLHRVNAERREFLMALWRENKKKFESALLQGRATNPFHETVRPTWDKELGKGTNGGEAKGTYIKKSREANSSTNPSNVANESRKQEEDPLLAVEDGGDASDTADNDAADDNEKATVLGKHMKNFSYTPYPLDVVELESPTQAQLLSSQKNQKQIDDLVDYFTHAKRQLAAEDLALLDFNSANIIYKQKQLASAFLDRLVPKIKSTQEYKTSVSGLPLGHLQGGALKPIDKFRRVLLRYANLAGHDASAGGANVDSIDEDEATRVDRLASSPTGLFSSSPHSDQSVAPNSSKVIEGAKLSPSLQQQHKNRSSLANHMERHPAATAKLISVFRNSWGRSTLSPDVEESEAIVRASVLEDALLINIMDAYFHLLSEGLQRKFLGYVREERTRHEAMVPSPTSSSYTSSTSIGFERGIGGETKTTASAVSLLLNPSTFAKNKKAVAEDKKNEAAKKEAEEALRHITRLHLMDKYNAMDSAKERQFAELAQSRKLAAERLRNRHNINNTDDDNNNNENEANEHNNNQTQQEAQIPQLVDEDSAAQTVARSAPPSSSLPAPSSVALSLVTNNNNSGPLTPERLAQIKKMLQSTDAWFGYEEGKREAHKNLMIGAGFADLVGAGPGTNAARRILQQQRQRETTPPPALGLAENDLSTTASHALFNNTAGGGMSPNSTALSTVNKSRAEVLRLNKLHELQACWSALSVHYTIKLSLHDKWNAKDKDAKALDKALALYKEGTVAVLCREAVMEAIIENEKRMPAGAGGSSHADSATSKGIQIKGGAFLSKAFSPKSTTQTRGGGGGRNRDFLANSEALSRLAEFEQRSSGTALSATALDASPATDKSSVTATSTANVSTFSSPRSNTANQHSHEVEALEKGSAQAIALPTNPVIEALREISALPSTGNKRKDCELARHRLFSELTTCSQRCDVAARRLLAETGDELMFKNGPYLIKMKEDYERVRAMMREANSQRF